MGLSRPNFLLEYCLKQLSPDTCHWVEPHQDRAALVRGSPRPPSLGEATQFKMVSGENNSLSDVITFDILDGEIVDSDSNLTETLTQDEREEIMNIVDALDSVNSRELIDFAMPTKELRHEAITSEELECLTSKNNAESTGYQTKWAITVFKGSTNY